MGSRMSRSMAFFGLVLSVFNKTNTFYSLYVISSSHL